MQISSFGSHGFSSDEEVIFCIYGFYACNGTGDKKWKRKNAVVPRVMDAQTNFKNECGNVMSFGIHADLHPTIESEKTDYATSKIRDFNCSHKGKKDFIWSVKMLLMFYSQSSYQVAK